jgi:hypothetical protein
VVRSSNVLSPFKNPITKRRSSMVRRSGMLRRQRIGEGPNEEEENEEAELECAPRQSRRSHMVAPPIVPARKEDRVLIGPMGDR